MDDIEFTALDIEERKEIEIPGENGYILSTKSFGKIHFKGGANRGAAEFARIDVNTKAEHIFDLLTKYWQLGQPRLLISITGSAKSFSVNAGLKNWFSNGLLKVAKTPGTWIFTGGTNTGIMKYIGETLQGVCKACVGIGTWGTVTNAEKLVVNGKHVKYEIACSLGSKGAFIDPNHTHHLLVDDGSFQSFGVELNLRSKLETFIMKTGVPSILLALNGGPSMLTIIRDAVFNEHTVFIIVGSGRCADLLVFAYKTISDKSIAKLNDETYRDSKILKKVCKFLPELDTKEKQLEGYKVLMDCLKKKQFITLLEMLENSSVDEAVLNSILNKDKSLFNQLLITLWWNQAEKAKDCISTVAKLASEKEEKDLKNAMIVALAMNRVDFVKLFLSYGISIQTLLTVDILEFLYGYRYKVARLKNKLNLLNYFDVKEDFKSSCDKKLSEDVKIVMQLLCKYDNLDPDHISISLKKVKEAIHKACHVFMNHGTDQFIEGSHSKRPFCYPLRELFFFALVSNMHEMALYFWSFEEQSLAKAFFGREICKYFVKKVKTLDLPDDIVQRSKQNEAVFSNLCVNLLDQCFRTNRSKTEKLLTCSINQYNSDTCLSLAVLSDHKDFVSHYAVQRLMNDVWTGYIKTNLSSLQYLIAIMFPPYIYSFEFLKNSSSNGMDFSKSENQFSIMGYCSNCFLRKKREVPLNYDECIRPEEPLKRLDLSEEDLRLSSGKIVPKVEAKMYFTAKIWNFYFNTPVVKFMTNMFSYFIFLLLFAYVAMYEAKKKPSVFEWVLVIYIFSLTLEEIRQVIQEESISIKGKILNWWSSYWNKLDALAIATFCIGLGLRFDEKTLDVAHILYAINIGMWVLRLLNVFYVHPVLGPYVVMISKMFLDMIYFLLILFVFLVAFGVSIASILMPQGSKKSMVVETIFHPYFNIYGELFIDRDSQENKTRFGTDMRNDYAEPIAWVLLGAYLLITNVLLLNLLIAIFNNTYHDVQSHAKQIWKFERYGLILEYAYRPPLIPPFIILCHIYMLSNFLINFCLGRKHTGKRILKSFLTKQQQHEINVFEKDCKSQLMIKSSRRTR